MTQEHPNDELLQRHFDGDLRAAQDANDASDAHDPEERALLAHLETCQVCRARLMALARLSQLVRQAAADGARGVDSGELFARIERGVAAEGTLAAAEAPAPASAPGRVVPLRRLKPIAPALGALAIAAAALLMVFRSESPPAGDAATADERRGGEMLASLSRGRSEIVQIDFGDNAGTVFDIALADGSSVPVVWINDEE